MAFEAEGDRLYELALDEFTKARDALAARLKSAGDAAEAAAVKALKKPTTPAWAVNQLARSSRDVVEQLIAASDRLRRAQQELLRGGPAQDVWEATLAEREALGTLTEAAERILTGAGYGATRATLDRISDTLAAAAADPSHRSLLRRGVLVTELHRAGFGDLLGDATESRGLHLVEPLPASDAREEPKPQPAGKAARGGTTAKQMLEAEREATRLERAAAHAEDEAEKAERAAEQAGEAAESASKRLDAAEKESGRARAAATAARKEARIARRDAERASTRLEKLRTTRRS